MLVTTLPSDNRRHLEEIAEWYATQARQAADRYAAINFPECNESTYPSLLREILYYADVTQQSAILEVGCGNGLLIEQFHREGYRNIVGCDLSTDLIEQARKSLPEMPFFVTDAADLTMFPDESYDLVYMCGILQDFPNDDEYVKSAIRESFRVTKGGGSLMILGVLGSYWKQWYKRFDRHRFQKHGVRETVITLKTLFTESARKVMHPRHLPISLRFTDPYIFFEALEKQNCCIYPMLQVLNTIPLGLRRFRYDVLIRKLRQRENGIPAESLNHL